MSDGTAIQERNRLRPDELAKLRQALDLIGDVQVARAKITCNHHEERADWREFYRIRVALGREIARLNGEKVWP